MWITANLVFFIFSIGHVLITPRFNTTQIRKVGLQWSFMFFGLNSLWFFSTNYLQNLDPTFLWHHNPLTLFLLVPNHSLFALDVIAGLLVVLSTCLIPVCLLASWNSIKFLWKEFVICLLTIDILLVLTFTVLDLIWFYIFFEGILIPVFIVIGVWGSRQDKVTAAFYFFFYTLLGSILFLLSIFFIYYKTGTTNLTLLQLIPLEPEWQNYLFIGFMLSFAVKLPQFPCHIWLPQAHVEAPVAGSILLAGILLKLGGYGYIRFCFPLFPNATVYFGPLMCALGFLAVFWGSINTLRQADMKRLVAYSSVAHMGLVTLALFSNHPEGILGAMLVMVAHGFVSPALFIMVTFLYDRFHTRLIRYYRGLTYATPLFSLLFLILSLMNMGLPPTGNFIAEFICLLALFKVSPLTTLFAGSGVILSAAYALWFCNRICFGSLSNHLLWIKDINRRETFLIAPLIILPIFIGLFPASLANPLNSLITLSNHLL
uniref:NADH-ubiquinone oxidoreductase chain 4 n=1 Tax=Craterolophus convolvulus TaxID=37531 RepID=G9IT52_9CNID|nr:NADH dehydrogenase subunit 4 [Craterolophus convolvulus]